MDGPLCLLRNNIYILFNFIILSYFMEFSIVFIKYFIYLFHLFYYFPLSYGMFHCVY